MAENVAGGKTEMGKRKRDEFEPNLKPQQLCVLCNELYDELFPTQCECPPVCKGCLSIHFRGKDVCDYCHTALAKAEPSALAQVKPPTPASVEVEPPAPAPAEVEPPAPTPVEVEPPALAPTQVEPPAPAEVEPPAPAEVEPPAPAQVEFEPPADILSPIRFSTSTNISSPSIQATDVRLEEPYRSSDSSIKDYKSTPTSTDESSDGSTGSM